MDSQPPAPWSFAARAAYFGDRLCAFCERHNPAGARFCNDCGYPLDLKPCARCAAVNPVAATTCSKCGSDYDPPIITSAAPPLSAGISAAPVPASARSVEQEVGPTPVTASLAAQASRTGSRWWRPGYVAAVAMIVIAAVYGAYRVETPRPDGLQVPRDAIADGSSKAPTVASAAPTSAEPEPSAAPPDAVGVNRTPVPVEAERPVVETGTAGIRRAPATVESGATSAGSEPAALDADASGTVPQPAPLEADATASAPQSAPLEADATATVPQPAERGRPAPFRARAPRTKPATAKFASVHPGPQARPLTRHASASQRKAPVSASARAARMIATQHSGGHVAQTRHAHASDGAQMMNISLSQCGSDLITRIVCDQRVRRRYCAGRWGAAPECASGIINDRGQ